MNIGEKFTIALEESNWLEVTYIGNHREQDVDLAKFAHEVRDAEGRGYIVTNYVPVSRLTTDDHTIMRNKIVFTTLVIEGMDIYEGQKQSLDRITSRRIAA